MITRYEFKNYRALKDVKLDLTPMHVLIGPNGSGKSTILEAIRVFSRSLQMEVSQAFPQPFVPNELLWKGESKGDIEFAVDLSQLSDFFRYRLCVRISDKGGLRVWKDAVAQKTSPPNDGHLQDVKQTEAATSVFRRDLANERVRAILESIAALCSDAAYCRWIPQAMAQPVAFKVRPELVFPIPATGFGMAHAMLQLQLYDNDRFLSINRSMTTLFPELIRIGLRPSRGHFRPQLDRLDNEELDDGHQIIFTFRDFTAPIPGSRVSEGMLLVLGYLVLLHSPFPPKLLLIEEPENAVHPRRLAEIVKILREIVDTHKSTQILMTTHSPYLVDHFAPEEVTLCQLDSEGAVELHRFSESEEIRRNAKTFTLGEIWMGAGEDRIAESPSPESAK